MTTFKIYFDGGTLAKRSPKHDWIKNPTRPDSGRTHEIEGGEGYGSWEVEWNGFSKKVSREIFKPEDYELPTITNNSAEYLSLMEALIWIQSVADKNSFTVKIHGDSQLVLFTLSGRYQTKKPHLKSFRDRCLKLLEDFSGFSVEWQGRINNVRRFGH